MSTRTATGVLGAALLAGFAPGASAQERFEIDHGAGRVIVNDLDRSLLNFAFAVDRDRRRIYAVDLMDPVVVLAFSLDDGTLIRSFAAAEGDGPGELRGISMLAATRSGVIAGQGDRLNHWSADGELLWSWRPQGVHLADVCALGGAVAFPNGDSFGIRAEDGRVEAIAARASASLDDDFAARSANIACVGEVVYVQRRDRLTGYRSDGGSFDVPIPEALHEAAARRRDGFRAGYHDWFQNLASDDRGHLLLTVPLFGVNRIRIAGAALDPVTGCYALIEDPSSPRGAYELMSLHADSAVVYVRGQSVRRLRGREVTVFDPEAFMIALRPLRRVGGDPCEATLR